MIKRLIALLVCFAFSISNLQYVHAQDFSINQLPVPGTMVGLSTPFAPLALKGLVVNPQRPLEFQFIVDTGRGAQDTASIKDQANQLVKYFLAGLTIPEGDLWVNLSPYEKDRMVPTVLGQTDLGRDLLAQDYILKQLTASLIYPEKDLGKEFWSRVYAKAQKQFGTTNIPVNTFNKVWILPDQAQVFENGYAAYVTKSTLKVMLDEDYLAKQKHQETSASSISSQVVREIVLPEIEKEVNTGKNFAPLRQIYQALILAKWYKETIQNGLLDAVYTNKNKVAGVNLDDPTVKEEIYQRYIQAYKKGAFNYIKEASMPDGQVVPRKYFSGGTNFENIPEARDYNPADVHGDGSMLSVRIFLQKPPLVWQWARNWWPKIPYRLMAGLTIVGALSGCSSFIQNGTNAPITPPAYHSRPNVDAPNQWYKVFKPVVVPPIRNIAPYRPDHAMINRIPTFEEGRLLASQFSVLMYNDATEEELKKKDIDVLMIPGNDDLNVYRKVLDLKAQGIGKYILISGGTGRLTKDIKSVADANGFKVEMASEAEMIRSILIQMAEQNKKWEVLLPDLRNDAVVILEPKASFTVQNFLFAKAELKKRGLLPENGAKAFKILYIQKPLQQLRTKGNFESVFKSEIAAGQVEGVSFTTDYIPNDKVRSDIVGEFFRIVANGQKGDWVTKQGYGIVPEDKWSEASQLFNTMDIQEKDDLVKILWANVVNMQMTKEDVLRNLSGNVLAFTKVILDYLDSMRYRATLSPTQKNYEGQYMYHAVPKIFLDQQRAGGIYTPERFGDDRFIHFSADIPTALKMANRFYSKGTDEIILLKVDAQQARSSGKLVIDDNKDAYPHLYGQMNLDAISREASLVRGASGQLELSPADVERLNKHVEEITFRDIVGEIRGRMRPLIDTPEGSEAYPSTIRLLKDLKKAGYKIGIRTMAKDAMPLLKSFGIQEDVDVLIDQKIALAEQVQLKSDPLFYQKLLMKMGVDARRCVVLDDSPYNIKEAVKEGFGLLIGLVRGNDPKQTELMKQAGASIVLSDIGDLSVKDITSQLADIQGAVFDMSGTIMNNNPAILKATKATVNDYLRMREREFLEPFREISSEEYLRFDLQRSSEGLKNFFRARGVVLPDFAMLQRPKEAPDTAIVGKMPLLVNMQTIKDSQKMKDEAMAVNTFDLTVLSVIGLGIASVGIGVLCIIWQDMSTKRKILDVSKKIESEVIKGGHKINNDYLTALVAERIELEMQLYPYSGMPPGSQTIPDKIREALIFLSEGYDFELQFIPEVKHEEPSHVDSGLYHWVTDKEASVMIKKGKKLIDQVMLQAPNKNIERLLKEQREASFDINYINSSYETLLKAYMKYNRSSDQLHKLGRAEGNYRYVKETLQEDEYSLVNYGQDNIKTGSQGDVRWVLKLRSDVAMFGNKGGIDLNKINILRRGKTVNVQFDQAQLGALMRGGFEGFAPVIIKITPISNPLSLLGIDQTS